MHAIFDKFNRTDKRHACMISYWNIFAIPSASSSNVSNNSSIPARPLPRTSPPPPTSHFFCIARGQRPPTQNHPLEVEREGQSSDSRRSAVLRCFAVGRAPHIFLITRVLCRYAPMHHSDPHHTHPGFAADGHFHHGRRLGRNGRFKVKRADRVEYRTNRCSLM